MTQEQRNAVKAHFHVLHGITASTRARRSRPPCVACKLNRAAFDSPLCYPCLHRIDSADNTAESVGGIRRDMSSSGVPVGAFLART